jgi:two-component system, CitB family, sensor kinase
LKFPPELPPNPNTQETKTLLTLSRYLHFGLLQHDLPDTILIQLEYAQNRLTIVYHLDEPAKRTDFISLIHQDYFQQLLTELNGSVTVSSTDPLTLTLTVDYHEEAQNDEHPNR